MKKLKAVFRKVVSKGPVAVTLSVIASVLFITGIINAATTISTNISTGGTLSVVGQSTLGGQASTTRLSVNETSYFGGSATTTIDIAGNITGPGTLSIAGTARFGRASTTIFSVNNTAFFGGTATTTIGPAGNITQGTTGAATTTITVGCIQTYATSTDTAVRITFGTNRWATSTTQTADGSNGGANSNSQGVVLWQYGSCPI